MKSMSLFKILSFPESLQNVKINLPNGNASEVIKKCTHAAPVPWPIIVTFRGSPPKCSMFSWTQCKAAIWSRIPKLEGFPLLFPSVLALRKPARNISNVISNWNNSWNDFDCYTNAMRLFKIFLSMKIIPIFYSVVIKVMYIREKF